MTFSRPSSCRVPSARGADGNVSVTNALSPDVVAEEARTRGNVTSTKTGATAELAFGGANAPPAPIASAETETATAQSWTFAAARLLALPPARGSVRDDVATVSDKAANASPSTASKPAGGAGGTNSALEDAGGVAVFKEARRLNAAGEGETEAAGVSVGVTVGAAVGDTLAEAVAARDGVELGEPLKLAAVDEDNDDEEERVARKETVGEALAVPREVSDEEAAGVVESDELLLEDADNEAARSTGDCDVAGETETATLPLRAADAEAAVDCD